MKRTREVAAGENIPSCIVVLKSQHGYFGWEDQRQRSHVGARSLMLRNELQAQPKCDALLRSADGTRFYVLNSSCTLPAVEAGSSAEASKEVCALSKGISQTACTGSGFLQPLSSEKFETAVHVHDDGGKKERKKNMKRKKHRPKVVEDKKMERKSKMGVPMPPQTPKPKTPGMKKGKKKEKVIGKVTFARKKLFSTSLEDDTEWEEAGDTPIPDSSSEAVNPPSRGQNDEYELVADGNAKEWECGLIEEDLLAGSTDRSNDINLSIDELFQELAKLPMKSSLPLLKADLLQLNMECPIETLSYIVDNIDIPCLLYFLKQAGRMKAIKMTKAGHKLRAGLFHSGNKVLEDFIRVLKKYLPCLLLRNDISASSGTMLNNRQNGGRKRNANGTKEPKGTIIKEAKCQIVPYTHFKASCKKTVICNYTTNGQATQNMGSFDLNSNQDCKNAMEHVLQSVVDNLRMVDINREGIDTPAELQNALVPFVGGGTMVPYNRSSEQAKPKPHRAEVLLDSESNRVWRFLKENEGDDCDDNLDSCKKKWWENERRVFLGRAKSFTARMNIILGDRQFCPWKGSVVDSVVGVFLTQNVSDHLSSSAFISLAAKFPLHGIGDGGGNSDQKPAEQCKQALPCCDGQDRIDIQLNRHPLEDLVSQSHHLQNFLNSTKMDNENTLEIDVSECIPARLANISKDFGENVQNKCKDLPPIIFESLPCSNINVHSVDSMEVEREATVSGKHELKVHFRLNKGTSSAKMANFADDGKIDWEGMRRKVENDGGKKERECDSLDSVNWEAVRSADVKKISEAIRERGMSNVLAERIKDFLNRLVRDHGTIDLEWLRKICPDEAKKYLLSIRGLGLKSVECVRLLTLQNVAFPVDTNVARISVRLGWVPLKPLPESLQLHLLEQYPIMDSVQKYIWPRLCKLDQKELYELHYHMITFGKVFCTKNRPNCTICPMRGECKHFNSAKLTLPAPEDKQFKLPSFPDTPLSGYGASEPLQLQYDNNVSGVLHDNFDPIIEYPPSPIIEERPPSPPHEALHIFDMDIEDAFYEDDEIPTVKLNLEKFGSSLQNLVQQSDTKILDNDVSNALVELSAATASVPFPKLKNISGLRTEHYVYELPDSHPLLKEMDQREADDPSPYLLAIWTPGETAVSTEQLESCCQAQEIGKLCERESCFACNNRRELDAQIVRGTLLIPCRTAMRGRFPLNGTYFQINEVFADHESSRTPLHVPRSVIWNLPRRIVYFGTSIAAIFRGFIATEPIQYCFQRGFICVRGFDRKTREPKPLYARLHLPKSKAPTNKKPWSRQEE